MYVDVRSEPSCQWMNRPRQEQIVPSSQIVGDSIFQCVCVLKTVSFCNVLQLYHDQFANVLTFYCLIEFLYQQGAHEHSGDVCQRTLSHKSLILFLSQRIAVLCNILHLRVCSLISTVGCNRKHILN